MKRKILIMMILFLLLLGGCKGKNKTIKSNGTDIAKVLLANERLEENNFESNDNLLSSGKKVFKEIKNSVTKYSKKEKKANVKKAFNKTGTKYTWSDAPNYSNFMSYFNSYADSIEYNADKGSELIDLAKASIKTIDTWIKLGGGQQILLSVDKNSETIISRTSNQYEICRRYQNDLGQNVYEMFITNTDTNAKSRMAYISGLKYEYTSIQDEVMTVVIANKDKGYWDVMATTYNEYYDKNNMTFSNMVIKDEAIYETIYNISFENGIFNEYFGETKIISGDGESDMLSIMNSSVSIFTTGINNLDCFYIYANDDEVGDSQSYENRDNYKILYNGNGKERSYFTDGYSEVIAKFKNGKELKKGDQLYDGNVEMYGTMISPISDIDFYGEINLIFKNNDIDFILDNLEKVLKDYDFSFKEDYQTLKSIIKFAVNDSLNFSEYYLWQNNHINSFEDINKSLEVERKLINDFENLYKKYKDNPVIKSKNQSKFNNNYQFLNLNIVSFGTISNIENKIVIKDLIIDIEKNSLLVVNNEYQISFALGIEDDGKYKKLVAIDFENPITKTYENTFANDKKNKFFQLTQNATIEIPILDEGNYTLLAYISTVTDGIRVSNPVSLEGEILENTIIKEDLNLTLKNNQNNQINVIVTKGALVYFELDGNYKYDELCLILETYAYKYGELRNGLLEKENNEKWEMIDSNKAITSGKYRLAYFNNSFEIESYIVVIIN